LRPCGDKFAFKPCAHESLPRSDVANVGGAAFRRDRIDHGPAIVMVMLGPLNGAGKAAELKPLTIRDAPPANGRKADGVVEAHAFVVGFKILCHVAPLNGRCFHYRERHALSNS